MKKHTDTNRQACVYFRLVTAVVFGCNRCCSEPVLILETPSNDSVMQYSPVTGEFFTVWRRKPVQAAKFIGIIGAFLFGVTGFLRLIDFTMLMGDPRLGDGQLLVLLVLPFLSFGLVLVVFFETLRDGYRVLRAETTVREQVTGRWGYVIIRGAEAAIALLGVGIMVTVVPVVFASSTPAPIGVGAMLLLGVVAVFILITSFVRAGAELFVYTQT